jgi:glycosyltransferase involved in cell wall biosynthesis
MVKAGVPFRKRVSGITAHRNKKVIEPQMRKAYATHANSMLLFNQLKDIHDNAFYVPNGVDEEMFKPLKPIPQYRDNIVVGNVAKMHPLKGQNDYIIPAVKRSKADYIFHHSNSSNQIKHEEMVHIYQDMDCFLIASVEDGTPNPGIEAAACGRPLISNPIGNMPEFIRDGYNGFLIPERDVITYAEKIEWLRDHREDMIQMGKNARSTVEREWTWKKQSENYRRMLRKCL